MKFVMFLRIFQNAFVMPLQIIGICHVSAHDVLL